MWVWVWVGVWVWVWVWVWVFGHSFSYIVCGALAPDRVLLSFASDALAS